MHNLAPTYPTSATTDCHMYLYIPFWTLHIHQKEMMPCECVLQRNRKILHVYSGQMDKIPLVVAVKDDVVNSSVHSSPDHEFQLICR